VHEAQTAHSPYSCEGATDTIPPISSSPSGEFGETLGHQTADCFDPTLHSTMAFWMIVQNWWCYHQIKDESDKDTQLIKNPTFMHTVHTPWQCLCHMGAGLCTLSNWGKVVRVWWYTSPQCSSMKRWGLELITSWLLCPHEWDFKDLRKELKGSSWALFVFCFSANREHSICPLWETTHLGA
jgi:hypothetical protein